MKRGYRTSIVVSRTPAGETLSRRMRAENPMNGASPDGDRDPNRRPSGACQDWQARALAQSANHRRTMWDRVIRPVSVAEALDVLAVEGEGARIVAGGTDLLVELQRGVQPAATLIDVSELRELKYVRRDGECIAIGGLATHNDVLAAPFARTAMLPLAQACIEVGAPQIRSRGTIAGNLVTASPANDTIAPLIALDASLVLVSRASGERVVALTDFFTGFRATQLRPDELVREVRLRALGAGRRGT